MVGELEFHTGLSAVQAILGPMNEPARELSILIVFFWLVLFSRCPECLKGSIDQNINGDGRYGVEWYAVPCNVGDSSIHYSMIVRDGGLYWGLVVSNTR